MRRDVLVYISGPMTAKDGRTIEQNTADGVAVYLDLLKRGTSRGRGIPTHANAPSVSV